MRKGCSIIRFPVIKATMCSLHSAGVANFGTYSIEQLEDDFITSLFSQNIESHYDHPQTSHVKLNQNVVQSDCTWLLSHEMDHDYVAQTAPPLAQLSTCKGTTINNSSMNMSTYFATFNPSTKLQTNQPEAQLMQSKFNNSQHASGKIHRARINVVFAGTGNFKAIVKRKRKRTVFRTDQVEAMEEVFAKKPYVTKEDRQVLVNKLNISDKSVKVWFQNRRLKHKRGDDPSDDEDRSSPNLDRLDYVESKIHERTNEFGYVTLDDKIMSDLITVIDEYLWKSNTDNSMDVEMQETNVKIESGPIYEPISPASTIENTNEENLWECHSPNENEYLQRLQDIESIITS